MQKSPSSGLRHKAAHDPRTAAVKVLREVLHAGADAQAALNDALVSTSLMPTDKRLLTELVYGSLRYYLRLERFLFSFLPKPEKLPEEMRLALVLALYEILFLRIPAHAAVNRAVQHVRDRFGQGLAKVANGALRAAQRNRKVFYAPEATVPQTALELGERYAVPEETAALWLEQYGLEETRLLLQASLEKVPTGIRINKARPEWQALREELMQAAEEIRPIKKPVSADQMSASPVSPTVSPPAAETGETAGVAVLPTSAGDTFFSLPAPADCVLAFFSRPPWQIRALEHNGRISRQSAASYQALFALDPAYWPQPLWDACAGRGGKTLALLESGIPVALATDISPRRLKALAAEYDRLFPEGLPAAPALRSASAVDIGFVLGGGEGISSESDLYSGEDEASADAEAGTARPAENVPAIDCRPEEELTAPLPDGLQKRFGTVLIDAPCSGFGTLARRPEIRLRRTPESIATLIAVQKRLLDAAWTTLLPGGLLIYMTCTRNRAENEDQIQTFLQGHADADCLQEFSTPADSPLREFFYAAKLKKGFGG